MKKGDTRFITMIECAESNAFWRRLVRQEQEKVKSMKKTNTTQKPVRTNSRKRS